ncbi:MAG: hypothetical protein JNL46_06605 [Sphingosinicella sp.]|nr:hypothetical protein [Sphingosinicella sp.]
MILILSRPLKAVRTLAAAFAMLMLCAVSLPTAAHAESGPKSLLITYKSTAAKRPAFRQYLEGAGTQRFEALKKAGKIADYQFLFNWYNDTLTWDAMAIIQFKDYADVAEWKTLERTSPGGLDAKGLALGEPEITVSADLLWEDGAAAPRASGRVFYVIPYEYRELAEYKKYVDGYVIPQVQGWMREGILSRYRIFLNRYPVGASWDALFVYEYKDIDSFGKREPTIAKVREPLRKQPEWAALNAIKQQIRAESENVIADDLAGR